MGRSWDYYNEIAHLYDSQYEEPYWKLYHIITQRLIERLIIQSDLKSPLNVLDLGSGTGIWMEYFAERGDRVTCLEPSHKMIEIIQMKAELLEKTISIMEGICEKIPTEDEQFEVVNAQGDVFSYSLEPEESIKESWRVLKPGGILIGSVDNLYAFLNDTISIGDFDAFSRIEKEKNTDIGNSEVSHQTFKTQLFNLEILKQLLVEAGFQDVKIAGKIVFGPYQEEVIVEEMDKIAEIEEKYCFTKELTGKAEHLHFSAKKPFYK